MLYDAVGLLWQLCLTLINYRLTPRYSKKMSATQSSITCKPEPIIHIFLITLASNNTYNFA